MNTSTGAMLGRGKVSFYKIKRGSRVERGSGERSWVGNGMEKGGAAQKLGRDPSLSPGASLSILEMFGSDFFLASQQAIPILDTNPPPCQTLLKFYRAGLVWEKGGWGRGEV